MKQSKIPQVELTPLLDVVFILIFALMLNVNVTKAQDEATIDALEQSVESAEATLESLDAALEGSEADNAELVSALKVAEDENVRLSAIATEQSEKLHHQKEQVETLEASLLDIIGKELSDYDGELNEAFFDDVVKEHVLLNQWLQYEQISERYLFVEVLISNINGRVYINNTYAGVGFEYEDVLNQELKKEKQADLKAFFYDWLDHIESGYSFVFVTVAAESNVTRAAREMVYDTLGEMQPYFDNDQFLINRYTRYQ